MMKVELLHVPDCPNVEGARQLVRSCLSELDIPAQIEVIEGDFPSPTVRVNDVDVMGEPPNTGAFCRLDLPTRERVLGALKVASGS